MNALISIFPFFVLGFLVFGSIVLWKLGKRFSLGSVEGGAWEHKPPEPPGQREIPWELDQVDRQLAISGVDSQLVPLLHQMVAASPLDARVHQLGPRPTRAQIEAMVADLEKAIGMRSR